jgi:O-antigen/teichoic acid export membrane protein
MQLSIRSFSKNVFYQIIVQILVMARALVILPVLYKTLGNMYYGIWSQILITITLLSSVFTLRFDNVLVRYFTRSSEETEFRLAFHSMLFCIILVMIPLCIPLIFFSKSLSVMLFDSPDFQFYVFVLVVMIGLKSVFTYSLSYYRSIYRLGFYTLVQCIQILGEIIILSVTIIAVGATFKTAMITLVVFNSIMTVLVTGSVFYRLGFITPQLKALKPYLQFSLPLIPNVTLQWIINSSSRYFIVHYLDLASVSIYAACFSLGRLGSFFEAPIAFVLYPTVSSLWQNKKLSEIRFWTNSSLKFFLLISIPATFGLHYFAPAIMHGLTADDFSHHRWLVFMSAIGYVFLGVYQIYLYLVLLKEKTNAILIIFIFTALCHIVLNMVLIPIWGIEGSAFATNISYILQAVLTFSLSYKYFKIKFPFWFSLKILASASIMYAFMQFFHFKQMSLNILISIAACIIYFALVLLFKVIKKEEFELLKREIHF